MSWCKQTTSFISRAGSVNWYGNVDQKNRTIVLRGRKGFELFLQCYQLILRKQVHWLVSEKHFPKELEVSFLLCAPYFFLAFSFQPEQEQRQPSQIKRVGLTRRRSSSGIYGFCNCKRSPLQFLRPQMIHRRIGMVIAMMMEGTKTRRVTLGLQRNILPSLRTCIRVTTRNLRLRAGLHRASDGRGGGGRYQKLRIDQS